VQAAIKEALVRDKAARAEDEEQAGEAAGGGGPSAGAYAASGASGGGSSIDAATAAAAAAAAASPAAAHGSKGGAAAAATKRNSPDQTRYTALLQHVLATAHRYQVERLRLWCEKELCGCITTASVCDVLCQAHLFEAPQLEEVCLDFVKENLTKVVTTPSFGRLTVECPPVMLKVMAHNGNLDKGTATAALKAQEQMQAGGGGGASPGGAGAEAGAGGSGSKRRRQF
jgi:hypothetical protein